MLKSCKYCGRIHDTKYDCGMKPKRKCKKYNDTDIFRGSIEWKLKRKEIRERDKQLCQVCIRKLYGTINQYTYNNLSVHHAIPLSEDENKKLDNDNLLTVCDYHHELAESGEIPREVILSIIAEQNAL